MPFPVKQWKNLPDQSTPISAEGLKDLESRLGAYADLKGPIFNVKDPAFAGGAKGDGVTDDTAAIEAAISACSSAGGGTVVMPPGTYLGSFMADPAGTNYQAVLFLRSNVELVAYGATLKLKDNAVPSGSSNQCHVVSTYKPYATDTPNLKSDIRIRGLTVDCNSDNQTLDGSSNPRIAHAVFIGSTNRAWVWQVRVKNLRGTSGSPPGETMFFEANNSKAVRFVDCEADGSGATDTATGFSSDNSFGVSWVNCEAHDLSHGQGFTCWQSSNLRYANCAAYNVTVGAGYNLERSEDILYSNCIAGGRSPSITNVGDPQNPFFSSGQVSLPCKTGWAIHGATDATLVGCISTRNGTNLIVYDNTSISPTLSNTRVLVLGGDFRFATDTPADDPTQTNVVIATGQTDVIVKGALTDSSVGNAAVTHSWSPIEEYRDLSQASGLRWVVNGPATNSGNSLYRWLDNGGNTVLSVDAAQRLKAVGVARTRTTVSDATYSQTNRDDIIAYTSLTASRTLTLLSVSTPPAVPVLTGQRITVRDESGSASSSKAIVISAAGGDTIDGASSRSITTPYGEITLYANASGWSSSPLPPNVTEVQVGMFAAPRNAGLGDVARSMTNNRAWVSRFVPDQDMLVTAIRFVVTGADTVDSAVDVGIYDSTLAKIVSSGATTGKLNTTGAKSVTVASTRLRAGTIYYAAVSCAVTTSVTLAGWTAAGADIIQIFGSAAGQLLAGYKDTSHPLPASLATPTFNVAGYPLLAVGA